MEKIHKLRLTIGEFSKLCFVTVKTLRHYEKMGILRPHEVDEWTHYRYYDVNQMQEMRNIQTLKHMGLSLKEIQLLQEEGDDVPNNDMIEKALEQARNELCQLRERIVTLQRMQGTALKSQTMINITIKPLAGGTVAYFRKHLNSYDELGPFLNDVYLPEAMRLGCTCAEETAYCFTMDHHKTHNPQDIELEYCEIVNSHNDLPSEIIKFKEIPVVERALCCLHKGGYDTFGDTMAEAMKYLEEHNLNFADFPRFSYIHGIWDCDSVDEWVTEIQIPLK